MRPASSTRAPARARAGFRRALRAEWTKFRSVPTTARCLLAAVGLLVVFALLSASGNPGTYEDADFVDQFRFVHQALDGDGEIVARVRAQDSDHPWAMAGIMMKAAAMPGSPYAALMVTPGHGVRLQADFETDVPGSSNAAPRWLKLARAGDTVTGYESADGTTWTETGTVTLRSLPRTIEVGLFVTSPNLTRLVPLRPALARTEPNTATFDQVLIGRAESPSLSDWVGDTVGAERPVPTTEVAPVGGVFTVTGAGDIIGQADDGSRIVAAVAGTLAAVVSVVLLGVRFVSSEYESGLVRATLAAVPKRGHVLAAKAIVLAGSTFATTVAGAVIALVAAQPLLRDQGYRPPTYPDPSLADPTVLRVLVGTGVVLASLAVLGLAVATTVRHGAAAITLVLGALLVPVVVAPFLSADVGRTLQRFGPLAGLSVQTVKETDDAFLLPWADRPWTGLLVLGAYTTALLGLGGWLLRRDT